MIVLCHNHVPHILVGNTLPFLTADHTPAWNLRDNQKPQLVTFGNKLFRLNIVRSTNRVHMELIKQDLRITLLNTFWHGISHIGIILVTIQADQLNLSSIKIESLRHAGNGSKTCLECHPINQRIIFLQTNLHRI